MCEQISSRAPFVNTNETLEAGLILAINDKIVQMLTHVFGVSNALKGFRLLGPKIHVSLTDQQLPPQK